MMVIMVMDRDNDASMMMMMLKNYSFRSGNVIKEIIMMIIMMIMKKKHYGFRSGNDIKDGGFCTGTNDRRETRSMRSHSPLMMMMMMITRIRTNVP